MIKISRLKIFEIFNEEKMKNILKLNLFLSFLLLISCSSKSISANFDKEPKTNSNLAVNSLENVEKNALQKLYTEIAKNNKNSELKNEEIIVGNKKIKVLVTTEFDGQNQGKYVFAAKFDTEISDSNKESFSIGSIGIGEDRKDAVETSIDEWIGIFGGAFSNMLANTNGIKSEKLEIYSGLMGIRGEKPAKSWIDGSPAMNKKIISAISPIIKKSGKNLNAINLLLTISEKGEIKGECKLNNEVSQELFDEVKKLNWDKGSSIYMFKQFYLVIQK